MRENEVNEMNVNMYTLNKEIQQLQKMIFGEGVLNRLNGFRPIDYTEHITTDLSDLTMLWKYNGAYYKSSDSSLLHSVAENKGYSKTLKTFRQLLKDPSRQNELWLYDIQLVFAKHLSTLPYYIVCDGNLITNEKLTKLKYNPYNSLVVITREGERIKYIRSVIVMSYFTEYQDLDLDDVWYVDGFYGNCGIDNLKIKDKTIAAELVHEDKS